MKGKEKKRRQRKETIIQIIETKRKRNRNRKETIIQIIETKRNRNREVAMGGSETMKRLQTAA
jgi:hypothetical protein